MPPPGINATVFVKCPAQSRGQSAVGLSSVSLTWEQRLLSSLSRGPAGSHPSLPGAWLSPSGWARPRGRTPQRSRGRGAPGEAARQRREPAHPQGLRSSLGMEGPEPGLWGEAAANPTGRLGTRPGCPRCCIAPLRGCPRPGAAARTGRTHVHGGSHLTNSWRVDGRQRSVQRATFWETEAQEGWDSHRFMGIRHPRAGWGHRMPPGFVPVSPGECSRGALSPRPPP